MTINEIYNEFERIRSASKIEATIIDDKWNPEKYRIIHKFTLMEENE